MERKASFPLGSAEEMNDRKLSVLRVLSRSITHYHSLRGYDPVHRDHYMHAWVVTSYPEIPCGPDELFC
jgi:hypothetical protein